MVVDIKMCRFDNVPWGFRLVGGADYDYPLTVVKVAEGSIAEEAGLQVDDVIVRINDNAATPLAHEEANRIIKSCGNVFYFGVQREEEISESGPKKFPYIRKEKTSFTDDDKPRTSITTSEVEFEADFRDNLYIPDLPDRPCSALSEQTEIKIVEEEIAAVLSGETECLKEHNGVLGIFPKPGVCMTSDVLRSLNEEAVKTKAEREKDLKKWSTFLQKPNRPIPKSKLALEAERRAANAYKVKIVKSAPRGTTPQPETKVAVKPEENQSTAAEPSNATDTVEQQSQETKTDEKEAAAAAEPEEEVVAEPEPEPLPTDSEVPNLEAALETTNNAEVEVENPNENEAEAEIKSDNASEALTENEKTEAEIEAAENITTELETTETVETVEKTEEELRLEKQLYEVQQQLAALSSLPSTIKTTLNAVTKQLAELLPTFKLETPPQCEELPNENEITNEEPEAETTAKDVADVENSEILEQTQDQDDLEIEHFSSLSEEQQMQLKENMNVEEQLGKKQKKHDVIEELEEQIIYKRPKRSKRAFGPLVPASDRPLVLPGGRRWYKPKDAEIEEFIAETLSSQAELITGTTLGSTFESPLLGYDSRVNFMKYQKPKRKIDLDRSEVYKIIHHLDRRPVRGIEVRAPVVPAESDIRKIAQN